MTNEEIDAINNAPRTKLLRALQSHKSKNGLDVEQIGDLLDKAIGVRVLPDTPTDQQIDTILAAINVSRADFDHRVERGTARAMVSAPEPEKTAAEALNGIAARVYGKTDAQIAAMIPAADGDKEPASPFTNMSRAAFIRWNAPKKPDDGVDA